MSASTVMAAVCGAWFWLCAIAVGIPWVERLVLGVVGVGAGGYAWWQFPPHAAAVFLAVVAVLSVTVPLVERVALRRGWVDRPRPVSFSLTPGAEELLARGLARWLAGRPRWAEVVAGAALGAMASTCEACGQAPSAVHARFPDGTSFQVCEDCSAFAVNSGATAGGPA